MLPKPAREAKLRGRWIRTDSTSRNPNTS